MSTTQATILIVDDIAANRLVLERMVRAHGHQSVSTDHGRAAIELMQLHNFDMVLLDIMMPGMNGYDVLTELKDHPTLQHVPVVVVSALNDVESVARCVLLGAVDYLFKPVDRILLAARIEACLVRKRLRDREQAAYMAVRDANTAKSEFISLVSHELKNPLTAIRGYADMMQYGTFGPIVGEQADCLSAISELVGHMGTLLSDLSDLSLIEVGQLRLELAAVLLDDVVAMARKSVQRSVSEKGQQFHMVIPTDLPQLWADHVRVRQILTNLLSNASKYTPAGGSITFSARQTHGNMIEIAVTDSGIGISAADQIHIFEKFFRSPDTAVRQERGTGLGLNITQLLVESHGGKIWFESILNHGTTFYVTLPSAERHLAVSESFMKVMS